MVKNSGNNFVFKEIEEHVIVTAINEKLLFNEYSLIIDCGACIGQFSKPLRDYTSCNLLMFEPDPRNYRKLKSRFRTYDRVVIENAAIDIEYGEKDFYIGIWRTASSLDKTHRGLTNISEKVKTISLNDELKEINRTIDLLKIDIEGNEKYVIPSLDGEQLGKVDQISVEFHLQAEIDGYTEKDVKRCRNHLKKNGFKEIIYNSNEGTNKGQDALYINKRLL